MASNPQLNRNLDRQVAIYEKASDTKKSLKVIVYFSEKELEKVDAILKDLGLENSNKDKIICKRIKNLLRRQPRIKDKSSEAGYITTT